MYRIFNIKMKCFLLIAVMYAAIAEKITYVSIERPRITYMNHKYFAFANATSRRFGRSSPVYYFDFNYESLFNADNKVRVDFYFYEHLTNGYQRSFVEMHQGFCDLIHKNMFFGAAMKQGKLNGPCPFPPGVYNLVNMTILPDAIPRGFPFTKGRILCNVTYGPIKEFIGSGHVDMEIKQMNVKDRVKNQKL